MLSCNSRVGSANTPVTPNWIRVGPSARTRTGLLTSPVTMKPPIKTLLPVSTFSLVEMLRSSPRAGENSEVFPLGSVAVAVKCGSPVIFGTILVNETLPLPLVVILTNPANVFPSPKSVGSMAASSLAKNYFG